MRLPSLDSPVPVKSLENELEKSQKELSKASLALENYKRNNAEAMIAKPTKATKTLEADLVAAKHQIEAAKKREAEAQAEKNAALAQLSGLTADLDDLGRQNSNLTAELAQQKGKTVDSNQRVARVFELVRRA